MRKPNKDLHLKLTEEEYAKARSLLDQIEDAATFAIALTRRLVERAPFRDLSALQRAIFDLPPIQRGAPLGNKHAKKKPVTAWCYGCEVSYFTAKAATTERNGRPLCASCAVEVDDLAEEIRRRLQERNR